MGEDVAGGAPQVARAHEARAADDSTGPRGLLALFAKAPVGGAVKTRLVPPLTAAQAADLAAAFLADTAAVADGLAGAERALLVPRDEVAAAQRYLPAGWTLGAQAEGDLGARLGAALGSTAPWSIALGADHPDLPADRLQQARGALAHADCVFGPAHDGGFYLVGVRAEAAPLERLFRDVAWSTERALSQALANARALGVRTRVIEPWYDVDTPADLQALCGRVRRRRRAAAHTRALLAAWGMLDGR